MQVGQLRDALFAVRVWRTAEARVSRDTSNARCPTLLPVIPLSLCPSVSLCPSLCPSL